MPKNKYIETPDKMWELFQAYKSSIKNTPILVQDFLGKEVIEVRRERERPLTMEGFENYVSDLEVIQDLGDYFANTNDNYKEYSTICSRIKRVIRQDQIEGGMVGIYNPSITQRLNGLVDKSETTLKAEQPLFGDE